MKEGASAGKGSVPDPSLPSAKEGGIEGREGILGGEVLRWAKRWWFFHDLELYFHRCSKDICFLCSLFAEAKKKNLLTKVGALRMIFFSSAQQA